MARCDASTPLRVCSHGLRLTDQDAAATLDGRYHLGCAINAAAEVTD
jgi:hypothetical protein